MATEPESHIECRCPLQTIPLVVTDQGWAQLLLWRLLLRWRLLLWWCWPWPGGPGAGHVLVLPLPVSYDCSQQQRDDSHEVKVPLRSQKLVHINLGKYISNLNGNRKIVMFTNMSEKKSGKLYHQLKINTELIKQLVLGTLSMFLFKKGFKSIEMKLKK